MQDGHHSTARLWFISTIQSVVQLQPKASIGDSVMQLMCASVLKAFRDQSGVKGGVSRKQRRRCLQAHVLISETVPITQITSGNTWHDGRQKRIKYGERTHGGRQTWVCTVWGCVVSDHSQMWAELRGCFYSVELNGQSKPPTAIIINIITMFWV